MAVEFIDVAVVALIENNVPGVVHPMFLAEHGIVPQGWTHQGELLCTPPVSRIVYDSGIQITAEMGKLSVHDLLKNRTPEDAIAPALVAEYLRVLTHLNCTAVGVNFLCFLPCETPGEFIKSRFLKNGTWNDGQTKPESVAINLNYRYETYTLGIRLDVGTRKSDEDALEHVGVVFNANYNVQTPEALGSPSTESAIEALTRYADRLAHFRAIAPRILE